MTRDRARNNEGRKRTQVRRALAAIVLGLGMASLERLPAVDAGEERRIDFDREIRPILSDKCYACHGPDAASHGIRLRLDSEEGARADLGRGRRALVPGDVAKSELVRRITSPDEALRMPPATSPHPLSEAERQLLVEWVRQGARWESHWSFVPPRRPALPTVRETSWPRNGIDHFILARLEEEGMRPSAEADPATLLRRVTLDLTGLPPTQEELDRFLADRSGMAYEQAVDRLLASPRFGERMAFRWLDAARYADTNGYQIDGDRSAWRWRDWVIESFNRNLPYDQFIVEQLAGDLLPGATLDQRIATAFNRNHRINAEGGIVPEEYAVEYVADRVDTTATVMLGLTVGCARCHNHKYDPLTQKEYYQLFGYFNSIREDGRAFDWGNSAPWMPAPTREQEARQRELEALRQQAEQEVERAIQREGSRPQRWEEKIARGKGPHQWFPERGLLLHHPLAGGGEATLHPSPRPHHHRMPRPKKKDEPEPTGIDEDGLPGFRGAGPHGPTSIEAPTGEGVRFDGALTYNAGRVADVRYKSTSLDYRERFTISVWIAPSGPNAGAILTKMSDQVEETENGLPRQRGLGLFFVDGRLHFHMVREWNYDGFRGETVDRLTPDRWYHVLVEFDGFRQYEDRIRIFVDGVEQRMKQPQPNLHLYWGEPNTPLRIGGGGGAAMRFRGGMAELRLYRGLLREEERAILGCGDPLPKIAALPAEKRTHAQSLKLRDAYRSLGAKPRLQEALRRLGEREEAYQELVDSFPTLMVMEEMAEAKPTWLLRRGQYNLRGEPVERGVPAVLPPLLQNEPNNRLGLARWLTRDDHPLTARVAVNRFWQMIFGAGLVRTVEDFGSQGERPTHPALLDWLATTFRDGEGEAGARWDTKGLIRLLVLSATYRQSAAIPAEGLQRDPENRLLARSSRLRLPAEMIRDQALAVAGLLVERLGGPSVKPYQPEGLYKDMAFSSLTGYTPETGDGLWRRSLYTYWKRTVLAPTMQVFDASAREFCTVRESRTNTPLQSLNLMNDVTYVEAARLLAERSLREGGRQTTDQLRWAFRQATSRFPRPGEAERLSAYLESQRSYFAQHPENARALLALGRRQSDPSLSPVELAARTMVASLLLNLDETITRQ